MNIVLRPVAIPDFGLAEAPPELSGAIYAARCEQAYRRSSCDWLVVYADREHLANMVFLSGFEPRFEEALLLLGPGGARIIVLGNEDMGYLPVAGLPGLQGVLGQSLSLMGQDRTVTPRIDIVLRDCGLKPGQSAGLVGWKYFEPEEWTGDEIGFHLPAYLVLVLQRLLGRDALREATPVLMHPVTGLRSVVDADQIAAFEWGASRASAAVWRMVRGARVGDSELLAASCMGYAGEVMNCHMMFSSGDRDRPVIGLRSPGARRLAYGDGVTAAVGLWGGLSSRAALLTEADDGFEQVAKAYFRALVTWYRTADIGVAGGDIHAAVSEQLAQGGLRPALNPGHLTGHDEWINTPIRPGSSERIVSGMPFQVDVIPVPIADGWTLNCEDSVTFADAALRSELAQKHPAVHARIEARRTFMRDQLGVALSDNLLPLSNIPLCLPPFWLVSERLLTLG